MFRSAMTIAMLFVLLSAAGSARAGYANAPVDIRVWVKGAYDARQTDGDRTDVYARVDDAVLCVRAARSCYATVYVVDTDGYIHVIYPSSPADNGFILGGRLYEIPLAGLDGGFGQGVAYAYAVSSPTSFDYSVVFDASVCRIYGDPFVGAREFYMGFAGRCDAARIGVGYSRFYIQSYVRYPRYLCAGWHDHYGVRTYCHGQCEAYRQYTIHAGDPYRVLRPGSAFGAAEKRYARVERVEVRHRDVRVNHSREIRHTNRITRESVRGRATVKSSKYSYERGKTELTALRREFERRAKRRDRDEPRRVDRSVQVHKAVAVGGSQNRSGGVKSRSASNASDRDDTPTTVVQRKETSRQSKKSRGK